MMHTQYLTELIEASNAYSDAVDSRPYNAADCKAARERLAAAQQAHRAELGAEAEALASAQTSERWILVLGKGYEAEVKDVSDEYEAMAREIEELCADRSATTDYDTRCDYDRDIASAEEEQEAITERMALLRLPAPVGPEVHV